MESTSVHYHEDRQGKLHKCFHVCRNLFTSWQFWVGTVFVNIVNNVIWFPFEHSLWDNVGFLHAFARMVGVHG